MPDACIVLLIDRMMNKCGCHEGYTNAENAEFAERKTEFPVSADFAISALTFLV